MKSGKVSTCGWEQPGPTTPLINRSKLASVIPACGFLKRSCLSSGQPMTHLWIRVLFYGSTVPRVMANPFYVEESLNTTKFLTTLSNDTKYHAILDMSPFYPDHILSATPEFPLFAQAARGLIHVSVNGLDYTGPSLRTFLPLYDPYLCMIRKCGQN